MHMIPQITERGAWYEIDDGNEIEWVQEGVLLDYLDGLNWSTDRTVEITRRMGFGCQMSAPGYIDCSDWVVFATEEDCAKYLADGYFDGPLDEMEQDELSVLAELVEISGDRETLEKIRRMLEPKDFDEKEEEFQRQDNPLR